MASEATLLIRIKQLGQEVLDRFVITLGDLIGIAQSVGRAIMQMVDEYRQSELATNKLTQAMINAGTFTGDLRGEYLRMAEALQSVTTFADDQIIQAQAILQAQIGQRKVTEDLVKATMDLAAAKGIDLTSAAELVGKTIGTETNALARQGIVIDETSDKGERLTNVIDGITKKYGGQSEATAKGLGVLDQLKNSWSDFLENAGRLLAPFVIKSGQATKGVLDFFNSFAGPDIAKMGLAEVEMALQKTRIKILEAQDAVKTSTTERQQAIRQAMLDNYKAELEELKEHKKTLLDQEKIASDNSVQNKNEEYRRKQEAAFNQQIAEQDAEIVKQNMQAMNDEQRLAAEISMIDKQLQNTQSFHDKKQLIEDRANLIAQQKEQIASRQKVELEKKTNEELRRDRDKFLGQIATMQDSHNKVMAGIAKAAAIAQIWINTAEAASSGSRWGMAMGGPPLAATFAALAWAAGAAQAARVAGVQLAEGGIVRATPGGIQATIGEGGKDEAVIPLDSDEAMGRLGGGVTIVFNGPVMGDESQAMEFARAIDRNLLKLRQSNQSVAFETDIF